MLVQNKQDMQNYITLQAQELGSETPVYVNNFGDAMFIGDYFGNEDLIKEAISSGRVIPGKGWTEETVVRAAFALRRIGCEFSLKVAAREAKLQRNMRIGIFSAATLLAVGLIILTVVMAI